MKFKVLVISFFAIIFYSSVNDEKRIVNELEVKNKHLVEIVDKYLKEEISRKDYDKNLILIRLQKDADKIEIRIGKISRTLINIYLSDKKDSIVGFYDNNGIEVLVFGDSLHKLYKKTSKTKEFKFSKIEKKKTLKEPPLIIEPIIEIYFYKKDNFILDRKGRFTLLE